MTSETKSKIKQYVNEHKSEITSVKDLRQLCIEVFFEFTLNDEEVLNEIIPKLVEIKTL